MTEVEPGSVAVVLGFRTIGLAVTEGAKATCASNIIGIDIDTKIFDVQKIQSLTPNIGVAYRRMEYQQISDLTPCTAQFSIPRWSPLVGNCQKLNVDVALRNGTAGLGFVVRDSQRPVLGVISQVTQAESVLEAELLAIEMACLSARRLGMSNFTVELDAKVVGDALISAHLPDD